MDPAPGSLAPLAAQSAAAPGTRSTFLEPWLPRVRDIDDATLDELLRTLVKLRLLKLALSTAGFVGGMFVFGLLPLSSWVHMVLIYGTLSLLVGMPVLATGSLTVRRLFLQEGKRQGLSRSAAMLVLTRAERKARHLLPVGGLEDQVALLRDAVRDWDEA